MLVQVKREGTCRAPGVGLALRDAFDILCLFPTAPGLPDGDAGDDELEAHPWVCLPGRPDLAAWAAWEGGALLSPLEEKRVLPGWHTGLANPEGNSCRHRRCHFGRKAAKVPWAWGLLLKAPFVPLGGSGLLVGRRTSRIIIDRLRLHHESVFLTHPQGEGLVTSPKKSHLHLPSSPRFQGACSKGSLCVLAGAEVHRTHARHVAPALWGQEQRSGCHPHFLCHTPALHVSGSGRTNHTCRGQFTRRAPGKGRTW